MSTTSRLWKSTLGRWNDLFGGGSRRSKGGCKGNCKCRSYHPAIEPLEQRQLLSVTWNGLGGDNLWSNPANWVGGQAPGAGEDLIFSGSTRTNT